MVTAGLGIELATTTPQAAVAIPTDEASNVVCCTALIAALEKVGILIPN